METKRGDPVDRWIAARPLALLTACFLAGLVAGRAARPVPLAWGAGALVPLALFALLRRKAFLFAAAMLLGAAWISLFLALPDAPAGENVLLTGVVESEPVGSGRALRVRLGRVSVDGEALSCRVMAYLYDAEEAPPFGAVLTATADTWTPSGAGNPGGFDYAAWLRRQGVRLCATVSAKDMTVVQADGPSPAVLLHGLRTRVAAVIRRTFPEDCAGVVRALVLGDRSEMPEEAQRDFRASGVSHLLALSGLHVSVLFLALEAALMKLRLSRRAAFFAMLPAMAAYALLVGLPASVLRACLMFAAARLARLTGRPNDGLTALCLALLALTLVNPLYIEDAGFILSFSAVAGLLLLGRPVRERPPAQREARAARLPRWARGALRASLAAQLGALPAVACLFNQIPLWFLPFNLLLAPLMTLLFPLLLAGTLLGAASFVLSRPFVWLGAPLIRLFSAVAAWGARLPWALVNCPDWPAWLIALYAAALLLASPYTRAARRGWPRAAALLALPAIALMAFALPALTQPRGLTITFLDVGQGDAAVVRAEGHVYLIDAGEGGVAADYLLDQGLAPEGVFLSHGHSDHAAGLAALVACFRPCPIYVSAMWDAEPPDEAVAEAWQRALAAGWPVIRLAAGDEVALSETVRLRVWHPAADSAVTDLNANSMVCAVSCGDAVALFTGDLPSAQELTPLPDCTVLKVGHHGSKYSTGAVLIEQTTPAVAVISVGHNSFGHPAPETLARLAGAAVYRTDVHGAVTVRLDPDGASTVSTWLSEETP